MSHLLNRIERIRVHHHKTSSSRPKERYRKLQKIRQLDSDPIAGLKIGLSHQVMGKPIAQFVHLTIGQRSSQASIGRQLRMLCAKIIDHFS